jgi:phosphate transport system permease protein
MVIMASREALRTIPQSLREAGYALGAERWQTIRQVVLPMSLPGMLTGVILALASAIGETAPLITIGLTYVAFCPIRSQPVYRSDPDFQLDLPAPAGLPRQRGRRDRRSVDDHADPE